MDKTGPLAGLRIVELAGLGPGPYAAMLLADMGADVLRIDRPPGHDRLTPTPPEFDVLNRSRRSVVLDLRAPAGVATVLRLVERAEILIEGFRPGVTERLGVGPRDCWERNPALVYGRMTGWGQDGPWADRAGHDINYIALTGALHAIGPRGGPPQVPLNLVGDFGGGATFLVMGVLAALLEARSSGRGQVVDAAIVDGAASLTAMIAGLRAGGGWTDEAGSNLLDGGYPGYSVYETSDGEWLSVGPLEPKFFAEFAAIVGLDETTPPTDWPPARAAIAGLIRSRTRAEWERRFDGSDACVAPVLTWTEAPGHPQLAARSTYVEVAGVVQPAPAPRFSRTPAGRPDPPDQPGAHTRAALLDWGIDDADDLIAAGVAVDTATDASPA